MSKVEEFATEEEVLLDIECGDVEGIMYTMNYSTHCAIEYIKDQFSELYLQKIENNEFPDSTGNIIFSPTKEYIQGVLESILEKMKGEVDASDYHTYITYRVYDVEFRVDAYIERFRKYISIYTQEEKGDYLQFGKKIAECLEGAVSNLKTSTKFIPDTQTYYDILESDMAKEDPTLKLSTLAILADKGNPELFVDLSRNLSLIWAKTSFIKSDAFLSLNATRFIDLMFDKHFYNIESPYLSDLIMSVSNNSTSYIWFSIAKNLQKYQENTNNIIRYFETKATESRDSMQIILFNDLIARMKRNIRIDGNMF